MSDYVPFDDVDFNDWPWTELDYPLMAWDDRASSPQPKSALNIGAENTPNEPTVEATVKQYLSWPPFKNDENASAAAHFMQSSQAFFQASELNLEGESNIAAISNLAIPNSQDICDPSNASYNTFNSGAWDPVLAGEEDQHMPMPTPNLESSWVIDDTPTRLISERQPPDPVLNGTVGGDAYYTCLECRTTFKSQYDLNDHAQDAGHAAHKCPFPDCDATFSRYDVMERHQLGHAEDSIKYSCTHCKKWRAPNGFARKDHLKQHLRNYHHIDTSENDRFTAERDPRGPGFFAYCPRPGCSLFREPQDETEFWPVRNEQLFKSRSAYTTHLRKEHDDSPFPCTTPGCKKIGGKGYFRKRDLLKHIAKAHSGAESQIAGSAEELKNGTGSFAE